MSRFGTAIRAGLRAFRTHASVPEGGTNQIDPTVPPALAQPNQDHDLGNVYVSYDSQVQAIYDMVQNKLRYGCGPLRNILRFRATQIAGNGANFSSEHQPTHDFVQEWARQNGLMGKRLYQDVMASEMEGKAVLFNVMRKGRIQVVSLPWMRWKYTVEGASDLGDEPAKVTYKDANSKEQTLTKDNFVYVRVDGAQADDKGYILNATTPPVASVLWRLVYIDRAFSGLRDNNNLYARAVRVVEAADTANASFLRRLFFGRKTGARETQQTISRREMYVIEGKMYYVEPSGAGSESLMKEIRLNAQIVSGETGVPVHYMGFPDLMSNRSTAEDMHEMINAATLASREAWKEGLETLAGQACLLAGGDLQPDTIRVSLPVVMLSQVKAVAAMWLPLNEAGIVDKRTVREAIPGIDPEVEEERDEAREEKAREFRTEETGGILSQLMRRPPMEDDAA